MLNVKKGFITLRTLADYNGFNQPRTLTEKGYETIVTQQLFDAKGRLQIERQFGSNVITTEYNPSGKVSKLTYSGQNQVSYTYLNNGPLETISLNNNLIYEISRDTDYRQPQEISFQGKKVVYDYNSKKNGLVHLLQFGEDNALEHVEQNLYSPTGLITQTRQWTNAEMYRTYGYDSLQRLISVQPYGPTDVFGQTNLQLDSFENRSNSNIVDGASYNYVVNAAHNQIQLLNGTGYSYNDNGDLTEDHNFVYTRDSFGRITSVVNKNSGAVPSNEIFLFNTAKTGPYSETVDTSGSPIILTGLYFKINTAPTGSFGLSINGTTASYDGSYDATAQVYTMIPTTTNVGVLNFTYSFPVGNTVNAASYTKITGGGSWYKMTYVYDALGRRVKRYLDGMSGNYDSKFYYDGMKLIEDSTYQYIYGDQINHMVAAVHKSTGTILNTILNDKGTVLGLVKDGQLVTKYRYSAWGQRTVEYVSGSGNWDVPFGYTGMYIEPYLSNRWTGSIQTPIYHTHFRDYDPMTGRWDREDPAGFADGMNLYAAYFGVNGVDATGLMKIGSSYMNFPPIHETISEVAAYTAIKQLYGIDLKNNPYRQGVYHQRITDLSVFLLQVSNASRSLDMPRGYKEFVVVFRAVKNEGAENVSEQIKNSVTFKSHFGAYQYWHSMAPPGSTSAEEIKSKIISKGLEWFDEAKSNINQDNLGKSARSIGQILHMVQDSWSASHVERDPNTKKIKGFQSYDMQDESKHATADMDEHAELKNIDEMKSNVKGVTDALEYSTRIIVTILEGDRSKFLQVMNENYAFASGKVYFSGSAKEFSK